LIVDAKRSESQRNARLRQQVQALNVQVKNAERAREDFRKRCEKAELDAQQALHQTEYIQALKEQLRAQRT
jgi:hypothetical protein